MGEKKEIVFALAGNANVGKSVIFNQLTGSNQIIGNWPGKTVERAEGLLYYKNCTIRVIDLPGIYSLTTYSEEELITREFIAKEKPDIVINVIDATHLERNLFFTLQLLELEANVVVALNQMDLTEKFGFEIDAKKLEKILGVPVVPMIAVQGKGIEKLVETCIKVYNGEIRLNPINIKYGKEVEERINKLVSILPEGLPYPKRWMAIKLLEGDPEVRRIIKDRAIIDAVSRLSKELEDIHGENISLIISQEKYNIAKKLTDEVQRVRRGIKKYFSDIFDRILLHPVFGYFSLILSVFLLFYGIFKFGDFVSGYLDVFFEWLKSAFYSTSISPSLKDILWDGIGEGIVGGISVALPYIAPFYLLLSLLEDSGYLARIAFLTDSVMHTIGLHGKAFLPLILGFGCNVPAVLGTRILETKRQKFLASVLATLVPCSARTIVILGLVGIFLGFKYVIIVYVIDFIVIFLVGKFLSKIVPGKSLGLIMEVPPLRKPTLSIVLKQTWFRLKDFMYVAFPIIVIGSFLLEILKVFGFLDGFVAFVSPFFTKFLGLPPLTSITLIFGILRKELTLFMLFTLFGTEKLITVMTPKQLIIYSVITLFYFPCIATFAALKREMGWKYATIIALSEMIFAVLLGGVLNLVL